MALWEVCSRILLPLKLSPPIEPRVFRWEVDSTLQETPNKFQRWTPKRRSTVALSILWGETREKEAARTHSPKIGELKK